MELPGRDLKESSESSAQPADTCVEKATAGCTGINWGEGGTPF